MVYEAGSGGLVSCFCGWVSSAYCLPLGLMVSLTRFSLFLSHGFFLNREGLVGLSYVLLGKR